MTEKYEHAYEAYKIIMEDYRSESKAEDRKVARDLYRAKMLGKAANFIWQKNWEAAESKFLRGAVRLALSSAKLEIQTYFGE